MVYVHPLGNDNNSGERTAPLRTLAAAVRRDSHVTMLSGIYPPQEASGLTRPTVVQFEEVVIDGGLGDQVRAILSGDLEIDTAPLVKQPCITANNSLHQLTIEPAYIGASLVLRNAGRGVSAYRNSGGVYLNGGTFHNLIGRAFGGTADNMTVTHSRFYDCVLENYDHRIGKRTGAGGTWAACVGSWKWSESRPAKGLMVNNCHFGEGIWGETVGLFDLDGATVAGNTFYNSSHTAAIYGSSASNVLAQGNTIIIDELCPRKDEWRGNSRLPHGIFVGKEGGDNYHAVHNWTICNNTIIGGTNGIYAGWVQSPMAFDLMIERNTVMGQEGEAVLIKNWQGMISGVGSYLGNSTDQAAVLSCGAWAIAGNRVLGETASCPPDARRIVVDVTTDGGKIKYEVSG